MLEFGKFIEEAAAKRCGAGKYWCYTDKKCKTIPRGYHMGGRGYIEPDEGENGKKNGKGKNGGNGNGNGNGGNGNGGHGGNGGGNGSGGSSGGGGGSGGGSGGGGA